MMVLPVVFPYTTLNKYDCRCLWSRIGLIILLDTPVSLGMDPSFHPSNQLGIMKEGAHCVPLPSKLSSVATTISPASVLPLHSHHICIDFQYLGDPLQYLYSYAPLVSKRKNRTSSWGPNLPIGLQESSFFSSLAPCTFSCCYQSKFQKFPPSFRLEGRPLEVRQGWISPLVPLNGMYAFLHPISDPVRKEDLLSLSLPIRIGTPGSRVRYLHQRREVLQANPYGP